MAKKNPQKTQKGFELLAVVRTLNTQVFGELVLKDLALGEQISAKLTRTKSKCFVTLAPQNLRVWGFSRCNPGSLWKVAALE